MTSPIDSLRFEVPAAGPNSMRPIYITCGAMLCELRIWTEVEWTELKDSERSLAVTRVPGLGWIGAVPIECMN